ncbi:unnamed protein product [Amoebophrya sp. A25]|nr:unnamed protein product [Amoebophrya sp. A25]|eukprot:GSA25T00019616001.1
MQCRWSQSFRFLLNKSKRFFFIPSFLLVNLEVADIDSGSCQVGPTPCHTKLQRSSSPRPSQRTPDYSFETRRNIYKLDVGARQSQLRGGRCRQVHRTTLGSPFRRSWTTKKKKRCPVEAP